MNNNHLNNNVEAIISELDIKTRKYWVNMLKSLRPEEVGVIKASGKLLEEPWLSQLCAETSYLTEKTGFYLPIVIGGGVQYDNLQGHNKSEKVNGLRVTSKALIKQMVPLALENQEKVINELNKKGSEAVAIPFNKVFAQHHGIEISSTGEKTDTEYLGDVLTIDTKPIISAIYNRQIAVLTHLAVGADESEVYNLNAATLAKELVKILGSKKLIVVGDTPIHDKNDVVIRTINSELEFKKLIEDGTINGGAITNCREAFDLLKCIGYGSCVQITSLRDSAGDSNFKSTGLLEELLGDGSGTQLIMPPLITSYPLVAVDQKRLAALINGVFKKSLGKVLVDDYFESIKPKDPTAYLDSQKKGGAISYQIRLGDNQDCPKIEYLCKIFTHEDYEGMGIASSTINTILLQKGDTAWRASLKNRDTINYYTKLVKRYEDLGFAERNSEYMVFGVGIPKELKDTAIKVIGEIQKTVKEA